MARGDGAHGDGGGVKSEKPLAGAGSARHCQAGKALQSEKKEPTSWPPSRSIIHFMSKYSHPER